MNKRYSRQELKLAIDVLDLQLLGLMMQGRSNNQIAASVDRPLSTIQRRTRMLIEKELISRCFKLDYKKLGFKIGFVHVYLSNGNINSIIEQISKMKGILSVSAHLGNSDVVGEFVFKSSEEVISLISRIRHIENISKVVWSEEVYSTAGRNTIDFSAASEVGQALRSP